MRGAATIVFSGLVGAVLIAQACPAQADERADVVGVLPFTADDGLAIYSVPAADAVARRLRKAGARVQSLTLSGEVPAQVGLVIDGRIVRASGSRVTLEASVRDPRRARIAVDTIATDPRPLEEIDRLADSLGDKLAPRIAAAQRELRERAAAEARARREGAIIRLPADAGHDEPRPATHDERPGMLVLQAGGRTKGASIATRHGYWLAARLGYRPVAGAGVGIPPMPEVTAAMARANVALALMIDVRSVNLEWRGVLTARGRVRIVLVDARGRTLFDRVARTGTLVGSRGDGPDALIHYIAEQAVEIVVPHLRRLLGLGP